MTASKGRRLRRCILEEPRRLSTGGRKNDPDKKLSEVGEFNRPLSCGSQGRRCFEKTGVVYRPSVVARCTQIKTGHCPLSGPLLVLVQRRGEP